MKAKRFGIVLVLVAVVAAAMAASPLAAMPPPDEGPVPAAQENDPCRKPYPRARELPAFAQWFVAARKEAVVRLKAAQAAGDAASAARQVALLEDLRRHLFAELRRVRALPVGPAPAAAAVPVS